MQTFVRGQRVRTDRWGGLTGVVTRVEPGPAGWVFVTWCRPDGSLSSVECEMRAADVRPA